MKELTIEITQQCTMNCPWCSTEATPEGSHVPLQLIKEQLRGWSIDCDVVRLSGGEPLLHPHIREIIDEARYLKYRTILLTNGQQSLGVTMRDKVDEFIVSYVNGTSLATAKWYKQDGRKVSLHVSCNR
jgi:organic radical activating enzyme